MTRKMPRQRPHTSRQDYATPRNLIDAVEARFGRIDVDLAATAKDSVCTSYLSPEENSLAQDWTQLFGVLWCNPPFRDIAHWARKCRESQGRERTIILLTPASIGSRWFERFVHGQALVLALSPRLTFVGCDTPYQKDCMLSIFGGRAEFDVWRWR